MGCWHGYLSGTRCRLAYGPADATATHCVSCFSKIQIGFTFLIPAQKRPLNGCVCVYNTLNLRRLTERIISCYTHKMAIVS